MTVLSVKETRDNFAKAIETSLEAPVYIRKNKRHVAVLVSVKRYEELQKLEDKILFAAANKVHQNQDYCTIEESKELIDEILKEKIVKASRKVRANSMEINAQFDAMEYGGEV